MSNSPKIDWELVITLGFITLVALAVLGLFALMILHGDDMRLPEVFR